MMEFSTKTRTENVFNKHRQSGEFNKRQATNSLESSNTGLNIQRKAGGCACGGGCPTCQTKNSGLPVSHPTDASEIEADRVASKVMRMSDNQSQPKSLSETITPVIQTKSKGGTNAANSELSNKITSSQGGGSNLDGNTQTFMQSRFGTDFSGVKIHTDREAAQMNRELNAKAFTVGSDIYFDEGQYQPNSESGRYLLAHELTHVRQQDGSQKFISKQSAGEEETAPAQGEGETMPAQGGEAQPAPAGGEEATPLGGDTADPCCYTGAANKEREVHLNLDLAAVRVYTRTGSGYTHTQFNNLILGPSTTQLARRNGWCHMYAVQGHQPLSSHGLINFVNYSGNFGFHSNFWRQGTNTERIPGDQSHGCARLEDSDAASTGSSESMRFYNLVQDGDCVRLYSRSSWRTPTFQSCPGGRFC
jgi:hypothetical protein